MLTLEDEEHAQELRRELVVLLHLAQERMTALRRVEGWREAFGPLEEVRASLEGVSREHAAVRIAAPPFLSQDTLRPIISGALERLLGARVLFSLRILTELGETIQAAFEVEEMWLEKGATADQTVLSFTDERAAGEVGLLLLTDLRTMLAEGLVDPVTEAFPLNHYDILSLWTGPAEEKLSSTEAFVSKVYAEWKGAPVSATSRSLSEGPGLLEFLRS
ncbi:MAG: hypothetical protein V3R48_03165 [Thermoplasmata archaeon]